MEKLLDNHFIARSQAILHSRLLIIISTSFEVDQDPQRRLKYRGGYESENYKAIISSSEMDAP